jgi:membrane-associated phospholipid phosphatase
MEEWFPSFRILKLFCYSQMKFNQHTKATFSSAPTVLILIILCISQLDLPLAHWIAEGLNLYAPDVENTNLPDHLLMLVMLLTALSWAAYFYLRLKHINDHRTIFFSIAGTTLPISFVLKMLFKWVFGRTETHHWLFHPETYGFHWFAGTEGFLGFPSGHMIVFTPLFLALWDFFSDYRLYYLMVWFCLAVALIATEYHFLSDVVAGTYVGILIYQSVAMVLNKESPRELPQAHFID